MLKSVPEFLCPSWNYHLSVEDEGRTLAEHQPEHYTWHGEERGPMQSRPQSLAEFTIADELGRDSIHGSGDGFVVERPENHSDFIIDVNPREWLAPVSDWTSDE
jgi:hypothetical protein